jgi:hypothetical protein
MPNHLKQSGCATRLGPGSMSQVYIKQIELQMMQLAASGASAL